MPIIGQGRAIRPQPHAPIMVRPGKSARSLLIHISSPLTLRWLERETARHGYGALHAPLVPGGAYLMVVSPLYDVEQVARFIAERGSEAAA